MRFTPEFWRDDLSCIIGRFPHKRKSHQHQSFHLPMRSKHKVTLAAIFLLAVAFTRAEAQLSYSVTDLGTLGGNASSAKGVAGSGHNAAGMIVGSSTASDNSERAFLYTNGQMFDLNALCDLSTSDFNILTVATSISDSCLIIGEGITNNGEKHAFLLKPLAVDGGTWSYNCCQWVWIQQGTGWWWETGCGCYKWHGPPGHHPPCPPRPPHCWWWPLPCPFDWPCWCCVDGRIVQTTEEDCRKAGGQCYGSPEEARKNCQPCRWCCFKGEVFQSNEEDCRKRGGQCFGSEEEARKNCQPCRWCCFKGEVFQSNEEDCRKRGGQCFGSEEEARKNCRGVLPPPPPPDRPPGPPPNVKVLPPPPPPDRQGPPPPPPPDRPPGPPPNVKVLPPPPPPDRPPGPPPKVKVLPPPPPDRHGPPPPPPDRHGPPPPPVRHRSPTPAPTEHRGGKRGSSPTPTPNRGPN